MYNFSSAQMVVNGGRNIQIQSPDNIQHLRLFATNSSTNIFSTLATRFYNTANIFSFSDSALSEKIRIDLTGGNTSLVIGATTAGARLDVRSQGDLSTDIAFRVRNNANTSNLISVAGNGEIVASNTISASPATLSNQVVVKSQLDLKQNIITNPITGTGTVNTSTRWTGANTQGNGSMTDDGAGNVLLNGTSRNFKVINNGGGTAGIRVENTTATSFAHVAVKGGPNVTAGESGLFGQYDDGKMFMFNSALKPISFFTNALERMQITGSGNVGIGTTAPFTQLEISKSVSAGLGGVMAIVNPNTALGSSSELRFGPSASNSTRYSAIRSTNGGNNEIDLSFITGNGSDISEKMRISPVGNIGIGTSNPTEKLEVNGNIKATNFIGSASLTGTPTAPTATAGTNTTQIATTAFVKAQTLYTNQTIVVNKTVTISEFVNNNELVLSVNATSGNITITLPTFTALQGYKVTVKKTDSSANSVTVTGVGAVNIDGASTLIISGQYGKATIGANLTQYIIF
jgi:hypothetical protein